MAELLTVRDVAKLVRLSSRQVYKLASCGRMPQPLKVGRSTRWRAADIDKWIQNGCRVEADRKAVAGRCN